MNSFEIRNLLYESPEDGLKKILRQSTIKENIYLFGGVFRIANQEISGTVKLEELAKSDWGKIPKDILVHPAGFVFSQGDFYNELRRKGLFVKEENVQDSTLLSANKYIEYIRNDLVREKIIRFALLDGSFSRYIAIKSYFEQKHQFVLQGGI